MRSSGRFGIRRIFGFWLASIVYFGVLHQRGFAIQIPFAYWGVARLTWIISSIENQVANSRHQVSQTHIVKEPAVSMGRAFLHTLWGNSAAPVESSRTFFRDKYKSCTPILMLSSGPAWGKHRSPSRPSSRDLTSQEYRGSSQLSLTVRNTKVYDSICRNERR